MFVPRSIRIWLFVSALIVTWDYCFVLLRPATLPGGSLHVFWTPYATYIEVDTLYKDLDDRFVYFQSWLNCAESLLSFLSLLILQNKAQKWQIRGAFLAFAVSAFTFWKTIFYWVYGEAFVNYNTPFWKMLGVFLIPNLVWVAMPFISMWKIAGAISRFCLKDDDAQDQKKK